MNVKKPLEPCGESFCAVRSFRNRGKKQKDVCGETEGGGCARQIAVSDHVLVEIGLPLIRRGKRTEPGQRERVTEHHLHVHPLRPFGPSSLFFLQLLDSLRTERFKVFDLMISMFSFNLNDFSSCTGEQRRQTLHTWTDICVVFTN